MARRYISGLALPEYNTVLKIALWLDIDPDQLLFGTIEIKKTAYYSLPDKEMIQYILQLLVKLVEKNTGSLEDLIEITCDIINDIFLIEGSVKIKKEIINESFSRFLIKEVITDRKVGNE